MDLDRIFRGMTLSGSGMHAERRRLDVISKNIANANVVAAPGGQPYRRQDVIFETVLQERMDEERVIEGGVRVAEVSTDWDTPLRDVHDPKHPMADPKTGLVSYSNVNMAFEMVDLIAAARSYEANLRAMGLYRNMVQESLRLLEG